MATEEEIEIIAQLQARSAFVVRCILFGFVNMRNAKSGDKVAPPVAAGESAIDLVRQERRRQINQEAWTLEHDDEHIMGEMIGAAITYAGHALEIVSNDELPSSDLNDFWPWDMGWWKPSPDPIRNLVKSAALLVAEIERLQRLNTKQEDIER